MAQKITRLRAKQLLDRRLEEHEKRHTEHEKALRKMFEKHAKARQEMHERHQKARAKHHDDVLKALKGGDHPLYSNPRSPA